MTFPHRQRDREDPEPGAWGLWSGENSCLFLLGAAQEPSPPGAGQLALEPPVPGWMWPLAGRMVQDPLGARWECVLTPSLGGESPPGLHRCQGHTLPCPWPHSLLLESRLPLPSRSLCAPLSWGPGRASVRTICSLHTLGRLSEPLDCFSECL